MNKLTGLERAILDFETEWANDTRPRGAKAQAIRTEFGVSATTHYQRLNSLLSEPAALEYSPGTVNRLNRLKDQRRRGRSG